MAYVKQALEVVAELLHLCSTKSIVTSASFGVFVCQSGGETYTAAYGRKSAINILTLPRSSPIEVMIN